MTKSKSCPRCRVPLKRGFALIPQAILGIARRICFWSDKSDGRIRVVAKCLKCGYSDYV